jgi:hypothetical protein
MKLFLFTFRCKTAASFMKMEGLFGWGHTSVQEWFTILAESISVTMSRYNKDFLKLRKHDGWQEQAALEWSLRKVEGSTIQKYRDRIRKQNVQSARNRGDDTIDDNSIGSLGASDGTISVCPAIGNDILASQGEDPNHDRMYCEYKKTHGWKLIAFISHKKGPTGLKYILKVSSTMGHNFDGTFYSSMIDNMIANDELIPGVYFLTDHAMHTCKLALCPYTTLEQESSIIEAEEMASFNYDHSSDRMCSEHGMRYLKSWGIIRGCSEHWLFATNTVWENTLNCCWAFHNYRADGCPIITF